MSGSKITQGFRWEMGQRKGLFGLPDIVVPVITGREFGYSRADIRDAAMRQLSAIQRARMPLANVDTGWAFAISRDGWRKIVKFKHHDLEVYQTIFLIARVAQIAVLAESHVDVAHSNPDVQAIHRMYAPIEIEGTLWRVMLTIRDYTGSRSGGRKNLHALQTSRIKGIEMQHRSDADSPTTPFDTVESGKITSAAERVKISISDLLAKSTRHDGSEWDFSDV